MIGVSQISVAAYRGGGGGVPVNLDLISTWDTTQAGSASDTVVLPLLSGGTYSGTINWGDGSTSALSYANRTHVYASGGVKTITISGTIGGWKFNNAGDKAKITNIANWGSLDITTDQAFYGCVNLDVSATDAPTLSSNQAASNLFRQCTSLTTPNFSAWDVSGCIEFKSCFLNCSNFNGNIDNWDMSGATALGNPSFGNFGMFTGCTSFNRDISNWDVSNVTIFAGLFNNCDSFDQNLSSWNMSSAQNVIGMFSFCALFNNGGSDGIKNWDVSNVTLFGSTLGGGSGGMFAHTSSFNQPIGNWTINTSVSVNMSQMFAFSAFNQPIDAWNVSTVNNMTSMFQATTAFNQPVGSWNTANVSTMRAMFLSNTTFDQDISNFDVNQVTDLFNFMSSTLSTVNYDALLIAWDAQGAMSYSGTVNFGGSKYTAGGAAEAARTSLISKWGGIIDGGAA